MPAKDKASAISSDALVEPKPLKNEALVFYPAYCYKASPTWFTWVKLTAFDVHNNLHVQRQFQPAPTYIATGTGWASSRNLLLFYLNHPVQFIQLVGVVVALEDHFEKFWLFTLDDSSGATIDITCRKPEKDSDGKDSHAPQTKDKDNDINARCDAMTRLDIGTVVQVKGLMTVFRDVRQLQLERIVLLYETNQEVRLIAARTDFCRNVLSKPWEVSLTSQRTLKQQALGESEGQTRRDRRRQKILQLRSQREQRHAERISRQYQQEDAKRLESAEEARRAGQMLKGTR